MRSYMSIMNCRTEKDTVLICEVPEKMYGIYVPRMIVQPIIGNAFFHGFAEREEGCEIRLRAGLRGNALYIEVTDNGEGIAPKEITALSGCIMASVCAMCASDCRLSTAVGRM